MAIADKLTYLDGTKTLIADALASKGQDVSASTFREYATAIGNITASEEPTAGAVNLVDSTDPFGDGSLISKYKLDGDATDACGNNNGTAYNLTYNDGKFGQGAVFNGSSYVNIGSGFTDNIRTLSFYFQASTINGSVFSFGSTGTSNQYFWLGVWSDNSKLRFGWGSTAGDFYNGAEINNFPNDGNLHHVCIVLSERNIKNQHKIFIDGTENQTISYLESNYDLPTVQGVSYLGAMYSYPSRYYSNGHLDQVEIYNRALTEDEVYQLYTQGQTLPTPTTDGLIAYYPLTGTAEDKAGTYDGTENSVDYVVDAERGSVASFNGSSSYIYFGKTTAWNFQDFTISCFVKYSPTADKQSILSVYNKWHGNGSTYNSGYSLHISADGYPELCWALVSGEGHTPSYGTNGYVVACRGTTQLVDGGLYHICATFTNGNSGKIYVDAVHENSVSSVATINYNASLATNNAIGRLQDAYSYFNGSIANFRLYNRALTEQEILDIYNYEKANKPIAVSDGLVAYYPLKENSMDNWANEYDGTAYNVTYDGTSASFNGSSSYVHVGAGIDAFKTSVHTMCCWVKADALQLGKTIIDNHVKSRSSGDTANSGSIIATDHQDSSKISLYYNVLNNETFTDSNGNSLTSYSIKARSSYSYGVGEWVFVAGVVNNNNGKLYINGSLDSEVTSSQSIRFSTTDDNYAIGALKYDSALYNQFDGSIANVRHYNKALTEEEITDIYNIEKGDFGL